MGPQRLVFNITQTKQETAVNIGRLQYAHQAGKDSTASTMEV
ncbi:hypothetical protein BACCAP_00836 [Pseudoflavonifractor capillosus ATCC 29799]|uniref:Uncharacterized protein n=1 Tax=Pseudoflavonifractor capillosus ATCC 29799 TaxID=411467 RepID=A6NRK7_9FIRM|nr:hypothetical protein BACCAP_00836 [Pseudoflavonifractor capillosus ATCC 29799]